MTRTSLRNAIGRSGTPRKREQRSAAAAGQWDRALSWSRRIRRRQVRSSGVAVVAVFLVLFGLLDQQQEYLLNGVTALTLAVAASGLGFALGLGGEFILGQLGLFAVSAYVTAWLTVGHQWNFWVACMAGIAGAVLVGLALSLVGLRTSSFYFALVGFFLVYLIPEITQIFSAQTGGTAGLAVPDLPSFFGTELDTRGMFLVAAVVLVVALIFLDGLRRSPLGSQLRHMRDAPACLAVAGVRLSTVRIVTYLVSSALAGAGGAIYSHITGYLLPTDFDLSTTVLLFAAVIVGGSTTLLGPTIGVLVLYMIPNTVINLQSYADLVYGAIVLASVLLFRGRAGRVIANRYRRITDGVLRGGTRADVSPDRPPAQGADALADELADILWGLREGRRRQPQAGPLLVRGIRKSFAGVAALDMNPESEMRVNPGEVHLLLGPNGSGKSTLLNAICGLVRADGGSVRLGGAELTGRPAFRVARAGISRSFQSPSLPAEVTPRDLMASALCQLRALSYLHWATLDRKACRALRESRRTADRICAVTGLSEARNKPCVQLTSGQRRILDVLLAVISGSRIVLLDEPAAGLSEAEREQLGRMVRGLARRGIGFLVVEHDLNLAFNIADCLTVVAGGRIVIHGTPDEVRSSASAREIFTGVKV